MVYSCIFTVRGVAIGAEQFHRLLKADQAFLVEQELDAVGGLETAEDEGYLESIIDMYLHKRVSAVDIKNAKPGEICVHHQGCCNDDYPWVVGVLIRTTLRTKEGWCPPCTAFKRANGYTNLCTTCIGMQATGEIYDVDAILKAPYPVNSVPTRWDDQILAKVKETLGVQLPLQTLLMLDDCLTCT